MVERIPGSLGIREIHGSHLAGDTLGREIGDGTRLLVFLRHFG